ncbi:MAG: hypothetical protein J7L55_04095, partial [Desulfurococcales archaeon]|nr:hypothetical protein [Desulfurococcales archaeon]
ALYYAVSLVAFFTGLAMSSSLGFLAPDLSLYALRAGRRWVVLVVLPVAALVSGLLVQLVSPEAEVIG